MRWFDKLERKFGRIAIRGLMTYIVLLNGFVYILSMINPAFEYKIMLIPEFVRQGEIWRLITYIFIPPASSSPIFIIFVLYFYYMIGNSLEHEWGSFRFNLYYLIGMLGTTAAAYLTGEATSTYLNTSLFLAFARIFPSYEILMFFILPVKVKYLAWLDWAFILWTVVTAPLPYKVAALVSILNYFVFFGKDIATRTRTTREVHNNRQRFRVVTPERTSMHRCSVCGITENDNPNVEFRYCSKCEGLHEYCMEHLRNHEHKLME